MFLALSAHHAQSYVKTLIKHGVKQDVECDGCPTAVYAVSQDVGIEVLELLTEVDFTASLEVGRGQHNVLHEACAKDLDHTLSWLVNTKLTGD